MIDLKSIKARLEAATPGPWSKILVRDKNFNLNKVCTIRGLDIYSEWGQAVKGDDYEFISCAQQDIKDLLEALEKCKSTLKKVAPLGMCAETDEAEKTLKEVFGE